MKSSLTARVVLLCCILLATTAAVVPVASAKPSKAYCKKHKHSKKCKKNPAGGSVGATTPTTTPTTTATGPVGTVLADSLSPGYNFNDPQGVVIVGWTTRLAGTLSSITYETDRPGTIRFLQVAEGPANLGLLDRDTTFPATVKASTPDIVSTGRSWTATYKLPTAWNFQPGDALAMWENAQQPVGSNDARCSWCGVLAVASPTAPGVGATLTTKVVQQTYTFAGTVYPPNYAPPKPVRPNRIR